MITLKNKEIEIQVNPELGAALHCFTFKGINILRPASSQITNPMQQSLFFMIPYCSYIKDGRFNYFGINRHIPKNTTQFPDPIHGDGWQSKWQLEKQTADTATLTYTHQKNSGFPFDYNAKVTYTLIDNQLKIDLSLSNPSNLPMPYGMGIHPYFLNPKEAQISFVSTHIWHHRNDPIFDRPYPTPSQWDFSQGKGISEDFDTAFGGWDGVASITYPNQRLKIDIAAQDIFHHIVLYAPQGADYFSLEPVSNTPDAFNLAAYGVIGTGIQSIGDNQTLSKTITITCSNL